MSVELIMGIVVTILSLVAGGAGWSQIKKHGAKNEQKKQADERAEYDRKRLETVHAADLTNSQRADFINRL